MYDQETELAETSNYLGSGLSQSEFDGFFGTAACKQHLVEIKKKFKDNQEKNQFLQTLKPDVLKRATVDKP